VSSLGITTLREGGCHGPVYSRDGFSVGREEPGISGCTARRREKVLKHEAGERGKRYTEMKAVTWFKSCQVC